MAAVAVAAVAAVLTFARLGAPPGIVFDETYYVPDARAMLETGAEDDFAVHPPLGKWLIGAGIAVVGDTPAGWRGGGAALSVLAVAASVEIARRLTGRLLFGVVAGALVLADGVWITLARLAMLDSALAAFVTFGTLALVVDHQRATARASDVLAHGPAASSTGTDDGERHSTERAAPTVSRWPLWLAGVAFGAAAATKWSALFALAGAGLLALGWEVAARRRRASPAGDHGPGIPIGSLARVAGALVLVPTAVYALSWAPWLAGYAATTIAAERCEVDGVRDPGCAPPWSERLAGLARHHADITRFHLGLEAEHPYRAPATTWPAQVRPVVAHYESCDETGTRDDGTPCLGPAGRASEVAILGNPALWWSALLLVPLSAAALRRRDGAAVVPLVMLGAQFVPWLIAARPVFNFYTVPLVPMLAVAVVVACAELDRPALRRWTLGAGAGAAIAVGAATLATGAGRPAATTAAVLAATAGVAVGSFLDERRARRWGAPTRALRVGTITSLLVLAAAAVLLVYLSPLWFALPIEESSLRQRWWLRSWV